MLKYSKKSKCQGGAVRTSRGGCICRASRWWSTSCSGRRAARQRGYLRIADAHQVVLDVVAGELSAAVELDALAQIQCELLISLVTSQHSARDGADGVGVVSMRRSRQKRHVDCRLGDLVALDVAQVADHADLQGCRRVWERPERRRSAWAQLPEARSSPSARAPVPRTSRLARRRDRRGGGLGGERRSGWCGWSLRRCSVRRPPAARWPPRSPAAAGFPVPVIDCSGMATPRLRWCRAARAGRHPATRVGRST